MSREKFATISIAVITKVMTISSLPPMSLDDHLCFALYSASMAVTRLYKPLLDELGITYPQYLVLSVLDETDGITIGALAGRLSLEPSTITPLVKRLEVAGLVRRRRGKEDEREVRVSLAEAGQGVLERTACLAEAMMARSGLTASELGALNGVVRSFADRLRVE